MQPPRVPPRPLPVPAEARLAVVPAAASAMRPRMWIPLPDHWSSLILPHHRIYHDPLSLAPPFLVDCESSMPARTGMGRGTSISRARFFSLPRPQRLRMTVVKSQLMRSGLAGQRRIGPQLALRCLALQPGMQLQAQIRQSLPLPAARRRDSKAQGQAPALPR